MLRWWNRSLLIFSATSNVGSQSYLVIADFSMAPGVLASFKGLFFVDRFWFDCFVVFYHGPSSLSILHLQLDHHGPRKIRLMVAHVLGA